MNQYCDAHSGMCATSTYLSKNIEETKAELHHLKGFVEAKLEASSIEVQKIREELTNKMDEKFKSIENKMDEIFKSIESKIDNKEKNKKNNTLLFISTILSPALIIIFQKVLEYYTK